MAINVPVVSPVENGKVVQIYINFDETGERITSVGFTSNVGEASQSFNAEAVSADIKTKAISFSAELLATVVVGMGEAQIRNAIKAAMGIV